MQDPEEMQGNPHMGIVVVRRAHAGGSTIGGFDNEIVCDRNPEGHAEKVRSYLVSWTIENTGMVDKPPLVDSLINPSMMSGCMRCWQRSST